LTAKSPEFKPFAATETSPEQPINDKQILFNHYCRVLDMYMKSYVAANIGNVKKVKSIINHLQNFSSNIFKSMKAAKKGSVSFNAEEVLFA
jgi:uncharacterized protein VirK/YbjX